MLVAFTIFVYSVGPFREIDSCKVHERSYRQETQQIPKVWPDRNGAQV